MKDRQNVRTYRNYFHIFVKTALNTKYRNNSHVGRKNNNIIHCKHNKQHNVATCCFKWLKMCPGSLNHQVKPE